MSEQAALTFMEGAVCPLPLENSEQIVIGHGSGGKMSHDLIRSMFLPHFSNPALDVGNDAAVLQPITNGHLAISTDSHVVWPLFFPGGDIGRLAVCGTVNDVAMMGAIPKYLTAGFILEEGFELSQLTRIVDSMKTAVAEADIQIVAGDTKVVQKGKADGIYINTAGIGVLSDGIDISGDKAQPGDVVILSGPIGDHGIAVLDARGDLGFRSNVRSDVAPLNHLVTAMLEASREIHVLRDPTRGGVASALNEIAQQSQVSIILTESVIPIRPAVLSACEMLGFDPLCIANEGKLIAIVKPSGASKVLKAMKANRYGKEAVIIGEVRASPKGRVLLKTAIGSLRVVNTLSGELLPRIC